MFEYLPMDLKEYLDTHWKIERMPLALVKVLLPCPISGSNLPSIFYVLIKADSQPEHRSQSIYSTLQHPLKMASHTRQCFNMHNAAV